MNMRFVFNVHFIKKMYYFRHHPFLTTSNNPLSVVLGHNLIIPHIRSKLAGHAPLPIRNFKRRRVAPRLQVLFLLDSAGKRFRPTLAREGGTSRLNELRMDEVCATEKSKGQSI